MTPAQLAVLILAFLLACAALVVPEPYRVRVLAAAIAAVILGAWLIPALAAA